MSKWSHLPNAAHIDQVLASVKANPKIWAGIYSAASNAAHDAAWETARETAWETARETAHETAWRAAHYAAKGAAYFAALHAITALIAYDDAAKYLDLPLDQLKMLYALTEHPAALLLQTAVLAFSIERELAST